MSEAEEQELFRMGLRLQGEPWNSARRKNNRFAPSLISPPEVTCPVCGTSDDAECVLISIDGTQDRRAEGKR